MSDEFKPCASPVCSSCQEVRRLRAGVEALCDEVATGDGSHGLVRVRDLRALLAAAPAPTEGEAWRPHGITAGAWAFMSTEPPALPRRWTAETNPAPAPTEAGTE